MVDQHDVVFARDLPGDRERYGADIDTPLHLRLMKFATQGRRVLGFERIAGKRGAFWRIKLMAVA